MRFRPLFQPLVWPEKGSVRFFLAILFLFSAVLRQAHAAACFAAILAEGAIRTGVLLEREFLLHAFIVYDNLSGAGKA